jgi:hypothetical protein
MFLFAPFQCDQLLEAAMSCRAEDVIALLAEGANVKFKDLVCIFCFGSMCAGRF